MSMQWSSVYQFIHHIFLLNYSLEVSVVHIVEDVSCTSNYTRFETIYLNLISANNLSR